MSANKVGKIRLKNLSELQQERSIDNTNISDEIQADIKTPEKTKTARNVRAATTKKKKYDIAASPEAIVNHSTTVKRTSKKKPLPGQLRIDSFFKSCTKSYKVDHITAVSCNKPKSHSMARKGRKRLFDEATESTTTVTSTACATVDKKITPPRKRIQQQRKAKTKCNILLNNDVIDLCSESETEIRNELKSEIRCVLEPRLEPTMTSMVNIPCENLSTSIDTNVHDASKENVPTRRKRKPCPPYKIVEDTTFVVDGFQFGDIPGVTHYFLSHYHADHYVGLTRKFAHPLYMSPITANLVRTFIPIGSQYIHEIEVENSIIINEIEVTAIDANHCPGAIMLLFKFKTGKCILHTGDFRASFEMESMPIFWNQQQIDLIYLDTTYLAKNYDFCHQADSIEHVRELVHKFHEKNANKRILHVCGSYLIGKEKVWMALADEFNLRVWTEPNRRKAINALDWPELKLRLCDDPYEANLHVINMGKIGYVSLDQYFKAFENQFDMLLGIRPSGWEKNSKPSYGKRISVIGVEYSEHSSYRELERFVRFLKPKRVISTVPLARDLFVTGKVPAKWHQYKGYGRMLSTGYQPSISTYFDTPQRNLSSLPNTKPNMILSPLEEEANSKKMYTRASVMHGTPTVNKHCPESATVTPPGDIIQPLRRFSSDAADDLLSYI